MQAPFSKWVRLAVHVSNQCKSCVMHSVVTRQVFFGSILKFV